MSITKLRTAARSLRADACRNRQRIVSAARDVFVEDGADASLDEIARRAKVGNATLYRHFPDRQELIRAVGLHVMNRLAEEADRALEEESDPFQALRRFVHIAADQRIGAVFPTLTIRMPKDDEFYETRNRGMAAIESIINKSIEAGLLRPDVALGDLMFPLTQLTRPLPGTHCVDIEESIHRHLELLLDGLRASPRRSVLPGSTITLADLEKVCAPLPTTD